MRRLHGAALVALLSCCVSIAQAAGRESVGHEAVRAELEEILRRDQAQRGIALGNAPDPAAARARWEAQQAVDAANLQRVSEIVYAHGWPLRRTYGEDAATAAFLVIQHADHGYRTLYRPQIALAVALGELKPSFLALIDDRIAVFEGRAQRYGTQSYRSPITGLTALYPVEDAARVNALRAQLGMNPLRGYP